MRNAFIEELLILAEENSKIVLVVGDLGYGVVEPFVERFPDRFFNAGVAEQNMMGLCAGLASEGFHVFVYSIANFPTFRCAEQIRNDVDYHNLSVTIVAVGGGVAYGNLGYSHHAIQDFGLMRLLPNTLIAAPGDPMEVRSCLRYLVEFPQPSYFRLGKVGEPCFHSQPPEVRPGKWVQLTKGSEPRRTLLTTGGGLSIAKNWIADGRYTDHSLYSLPLWGMKFKSKQQGQLDDWEVVVTVEDHIVDAGFGSWLAEAAILNGCEANIIIRALSDAVFGQVGSQATLTRIGGLS